MARETKMIVLGLLFGVGAIMGFVRNAMGAAEEPKKEAQKEAAMKDYLHESQADRDQRMGWWRQARFGMFIHWGLYAIPAGVWDGKVVVDKSGEWIMRNANVPVADYEKLAGQFNPTAFDAKAWVSLAKAAGMKYIVITSKHHEGFCMFKTAFTNYNIVDGTPFKRDVLKELADECRKQGIVMCWYHSILDWHHPDYLPRRDCDKRPTDGADYSRYVTYMKNQLKELVTNYGQIGVMWFDGEWDKTWTHEDGKMLYNYVRSLQPSIIVNNRVDKGRCGMAGMTAEGDFAGDFGTPEQEIPATGLSGVDWESCMTMNDTWGFKTNDSNWKSDVDLIRNLVDIASKGGNFLLNVGPTAEGKIPDASVERLQAIGKWMAVNSESIYGTTAGPFAKLDWGRCTAKPGKLYLHAFLWPMDGEIVVPGLQNNVTKAYLLADKNKELKVTKKDNELLITVPAKPIDPIDTVIVLEIDGPAKVAN